MSRPLVSIIVPTYNRAGFVETAIESLLAQDYEPLEVIVLDDGSTDETSAVLERVAARNDPARFRWDRHDNVGQAATINRGLAEATGELLGYLSSDDYLLPGALTKLVAALEQEPEAGVVYPWFHAVDFADRVVDTAEVLQHTFVDALRWAVCSPGVGALVRREVYERVGGWNESYRYVPDFEWWLRMSDIRFLRVQEPLGAWRAHDGSITTGGLGLPYFRERLRLLDELFAREDLPQEIRAIEAQAYAATLVHSATAIADVGADESRFVIEDRLGPLYMPGAKRLVTGSRLDLQLALRSAEQQVNAASERIQQLEWTIGAHQEAAAAREAQLAELSGRLAQQQQQQPQPADERRRPPWLRAARTLVPPSLRPRVGAAVHRLRSRS